MPWGNLPGSYANKGAAMGNDRLHHHPGHHPVSNSGHHGLGVLVKLVLMMGILTGGLVVGAGHYGSSYLDVDDSKRLASAEDLLEQTVRAVSAYSYPDIHLLDGSEFGERATPESSNFSVELAVTPSAGGLLKVDAVLLDKRTRREIRRFVTYRGRG